MYGYLIKKSFCDDWDNLLLVAIVNLVATFSGIGVLYTAIKIARVFGENSDAIWPLIGIVISIILAVICICIVCFAFGELAAKLANFDGVSISEFFKTIPSVLKDAVLFGLLISGIGLISFYCFDFYFLQMNNLIGFAIGMILFWIDIVLILSLQWFIPLRALLKNSFKKCFKKSLIIFFDNTAFSIYTFIHNIILIALSIFLLGFFPSFAGILIYNTNALKARLYKYDYLEQHPELQTKRQRRNIPWDELLYDDKETLGPRSFKSFLFPWKDLK